MNGIKTENGRIKSVETSKGVVECEYFVNSAGKQFIIIVKYINNDIIMKVSGLVMLERCQHQVSQVTNHSPLD